MSLIERRSRKCRSKKPRDLTASIPRRLVFVFSFVGSSYGSISLAFAAFKLESRRFYDYCSVTYGKTINQIANHLVSR